MKKVENMPVASRPRMALDPVKVRNLRIRSGMIGLASLDSRTMKETKRSDGDAEDAERVRRSPAVARRSHDAVDARP